MADELDTVFFIKCNLSSIDRLLLLEDGTNDSNSIKVTCNDFNISL